MAKRRKPVLEPDPNAMVMLLHGCIEDRMLRTGAIVETVVYPPGTVIPLSEALARNIDDYVPHVPVEQLVNDVFAGPGPAVPDPWVGDDYVP